MSNLYEVRDADERVAVGEYGEKTQEAGTKFSTALQKLENIGAGTNLVTSSVGGLKLQTEERLSDVKGNLLDSLNKSYANISSSFESDLSSLKSDMRGIESSIALKEKELDTLNYSGWTGPLNRKVVKAAGLARNGGFASFGQSWRSGITDMIEDKYT